MIHRLKNLYKFLLHQDKSLYRAFASITSLRVVEKLSGLAISVMLFRYMTKEDVATYGFIQTIVAMCAIFGLQELQNTISQSVSRGHYGTFLKSIPLTFMSSFIGSVVLLGFSAWSFLKGEPDPQMGWGFIIAAVICPLYLGLRQWRGFYLGQSKFSTFAKAEAINAIWKAILVAIALSVFPKEILWPLVISFSIPAIQNILRTMSLWKSVAKTATHEEGSIHYGVKANLYSATSIIADNIDKALLFAFLPPQALAIYMAAEKFSDLLQGVIQDIGAILAPRFATMKQYTSALDRKLKILAGIMAVGMLFFAIAVLPFLLPFVLGHSYEHSVIFSQMLIVGAAFRTIATLRFRFVRSKTDTDSFRKITVYSAAAHILASLILIPAFGIYGAVASIVLHRMALSLIVDRIIKHKYLAHEQ